MRLSLITLLVLTLLTGVLFALWPELDLMGSAFFRGPDGFAGNGHGLNGLRGVLYFLPVIVMGLFLLAWVLGWVGGWFGWPLLEALQPRGRSLGPHRPVPDLISCRAALGTFQ